MHQEMYHQFEWNLYRQIVCIGYIVQGHHWYIRLHRVDKKIRHHYFWCYRKQPLKYYKYSKLSLCHLNEMRISVRVSFQYQF